MSFTLAKSLTSLGLGFHLCKMATIIPLPLAMCENPINWCGVLPGPQKVLLLFLPILPFCLTAQGAIVCFSLPSSLTHMALFPAIFLFPFSFPLLTFLAHFFFVPGMGGMGKGE